MTPSSLAAAARRLDYHAIERISGNNFHGIPAGAWVARNERGSLMGMIGSDADLCLALLETMPFPSLRMAAIPAGGHDWECELQNAGPCEYGDTPLEAVLACVEAMEGTP
jgi:hypothetical protein